MISKPSEMNFENKKISMIIAGVPGIGKTTLALSSPKPLLVDLDNGVSRVEARYRKDTLFASNFAELKEDLKGDLSNYETIVIDTGGKLLEMLKPVVVKEDLKNAKRDGSLSLAGYGAVKRKFSDFITFVKSLNKHLIIIFHASEVQLANDITGLRIRIEGSSRDEVWDEIDVGGFVEMKGKNRTIGFSNCERYYAKGTHGISGEYEIPKLEKGSKNDFLTQLFKKIQQDLQQEVIELEEYSKIMDSLLPKITNSKNADDINNIYQRIILPENNVLTSKDELSFHLKEKVKELGLKYDRESGQFK